MFGYAGTGKSTIVRYAIDELGLEPGASGGVLYAAFTGKAALVMTRKGTPASTIHSLIYRVSEASPQEIEKIKEEIAELERRLRLWVGRAPVRGIATALARTPAQGHPQAALHAQRANQCCATPSCSCSTKCPWSGDEMARDLLAFGKPMLVLGDPGQLPPVKGEGAFTQCQPDVLLTESAPPGRRERDHPSGDAGAREQADPLWRARRVRLEDAPQRRRRRRRCCAAGQVICGKNATRQQLNLAMKQASGFAPCIRPASGEKIICLKNRNDLGLVNGMFLDLTEIEDEDDISFTAVVTTEDGVKGRRLGREARALPGLQGAFR